MFGHALCTSIHEINFHPSKLLSQKQHTEETVDNINPYCPDLFLQSAGVGT